jgi:hypothetical protein
MAGLMTVGDLRCTKDATEEFISVHYAGSVVQSKPRKHMAGVEVYTYAFLTSALEVVSRLFQTPAAIALAQESLVPINLHH